VTKQEINDLTYDIVGAAIEVHKELGPGLLESVYHSCMKQELRYRKLNFASELPVKVQYKGVIVDSDMRCDLVVEDRVVVELKAVESVPPVFEAQLLTYMKLLKKPKGILFNFTCKNIFQEGQRTFVNELYRRLPDA
jgi:GxxExxY protein